MPSRSSGLSAPSSSLIEPTARPSLDDDWLSGDTGPVPGELRGKPTQVQFDAPKIEGKYAQATVLRSLRHRLGILRRCYDQTLSTTASAPVNLDLHFVIAPSGETSGLETEGGSKQMIECSMAGLADFSLPQPEEGRVKVAVSVHFTPPVPLAFDGKKLDELTVADVEAALTHAGCAGVKSGPKPGAEGVFELHAKKGADRLTVIFRPSTAERDAIGDAEFDRIKANDALVRTARMLLAIESDDPKVAAALLHGLVGK